MCSQLVSVLLLTGVTSFAVSEACSAPLPGVVHLTVGEKHFYLSVHLKANYFQAAEFCKYNGMDLATVESQEENDKLQAYMGELGLGAQQVWISGSDLGHEGSFYWLSTGAPLVYKNFLPNQPDNAGGIEHCVEIRTQGKWNDLPCNNVLHFVCQF